MENPATWGQAEKIVSKVYGDWADEKGRLMAAKAAGEDVHPIIGLSLARRITDALRAEGLLAEDGGHAAARLRQFQQARAVPEGAQLDELVAAAVDLMSSQQAMPDDGSLRELAVIVREAHALGQENHAQ